MDDAAVDRRRLLAGFDQARGRFVSAIDDNDGEAAYFALFEALNWAVSLDELVKDGDPAGWGWRDGVTTAESCAGFGSYVIASITNGRTQSISVVVGFFQVQPCFRLRPCYRAARNGVGVGLTSCRRATPTRRAKLRTRNYSPATRRSQLSTRLARF